MRGGPGHPREGGSGHRAAPHPASGGHTCLQQPERVAVLPALFPRLHFRAQRACLALLGYARHVSAPVLSRVGAGVTR